MDHLCYLCFVCVMFLRLFIAALWAPAVKRLASWLSFVMFNCVFVTFPCGILGQVWCLIVSIPDLCCLSYSVCIPSSVDSFQNMLPIMRLSTLWSPIIRKYT